MKSWYVEKVKYLRPFFRLAALSTTLTGKPITQDWARPFYQLYGKVVVLHKDFYIRFNELKISDTTNFNKCSRPSTRYSCIIFVHFSLKYPALFCLACFLPSVWEVFLRSFFFFFGRNANINYYEKRAHSLWTGSMIDRDAQIRVTGHSKGSFLTASTWQSFPKVWKSIIFHDRSNKWSAVNKDQHVVTSKRVGNCDS